MEGFGSGMGNKKGVCGALSGVIAIISLLSSSRNVKNLSKKETYKLIDDLSNDF